MDKGEKLLVHSLPNKHGVFTAQNDQIRLDVCVICRLSDTAEEFVESEENSPELLLAYCFRSQLHMQLQHKKNKLVCFVRNSARLGQKGEITVSSQNT